MVQKDLNRNEWKMPLELLGSFLGAIWKQLAPFPLLRYHFSPLFYANFIERNQQRKEIFSG